MATFEGPESVLEMQTSGSLEEKDADGESYPCISHVDDGEYMMLFCFLQYV